MKKPIIGYRLDCPADTLISDWPRVCESRENLNQRGFIRFGQAFGFGFRERQNRADCVGGCVLFLDRLARFRRALCFQIDAFPREFRHNRANRLAEFHREGFDSLAGWSCGILAEHPSSLHVGVVYDFFSHGQFPLVVDKRLNFNKFLDRRQDVFSGCLFPFCGSCEVSANLSTIFTRLQVQVCASFWSVSRFHKCIVSRIRPHVNTYFLWGYCVKPGPGPQNFAHVN